MESPDPVSFAGISDRTPARKRRRIRFSLRTFFVLITLLGCWLGYQLNWIRQRHDALNAAHVVPPRPFDRAELRLPRGNVPAPLSLRLLGEEGHEFIYVREYFGRKDDPPSNRGRRVRTQKGYAWITPEMEHLQRIFPEATVKRLMRFRQ